MMGVRVESPSSKLTDPLTSIICKVASRCNLNCSYCYVYNKGDTTWKQRPTLMSDDTFAKTIERTLRHCNASGQTAVSVTFHGGEPTLLGTSKMKDWCDFARAQLPGISVAFGIQTNASLLNDAWAELFSNYAFKVGISVDGPRAVHDKNRKDHAGHGSYDGVRAGIDALTRASVPFSILTVMQFECDPLEVHRHNVNLGCESVSYLFPDATHETVTMLRQNDTATPCADYLIPIIDDWWSRGDLALQINEFMSVAWVILGGKSISEFVGRPATRYVFIEADGTIEGLDALRVCRNAMSATGLNVYTNDLAEIADRSALHQQAIFQGMPLPSACHGCVEQDTCGGGFMPHRFSTNNGFDNRSIWCNDLLKLFTHVRTLIDVSPAETATRRIGLGAAKARSTE